MNGMKRWMWALVAGMTFAGCIDPSQSLPGEQGLGGAGEFQAQAIQTTPPPAITLSRTVDMSTLWQGVTSPRKYVMVVAYTLPTDVTGYTPPPRFRAFGLDMSTGSYVFTVDGDRQTFLSVFNDRMLNQKAIVVLMPPGYGYYGSCSASTTPTRTLSGREVTAMTDPDAGTSDGGTGLTVCGTEPVIKVPVTGGEGGDDWLVLNWARFPDLVTAANGAIPTQLLPGAGAITR